MRAKVAVVALTMPGGGRKKGVEIPYALIQAKSLSMESLRVRLKIYQVGETILRQQARPLSTEEIRSAPVKQLIELMRETMRNAPGVGLAAPQVGQELQLAVIEDRPENMQNIPPELLTERERSPVPFHVIINPKLRLESDLSVDFFEGCLSIANFMALVPRAATVRVECLDHHAEPVELNARGWYARILQHEIDHLSGKLYIDQMRPRSFMTHDNFIRYWNNTPIEQVRSILGTH